MFSGLLVILVGLGVFRLEFYKRVDESLIIGEGLMRCISYGVLIPSLFFFTLGSYFLYTERPIFRRMFEYLADFSVRRGKYFFRLARAGSEEEYNAVRLEGVDGPRESRWPTGRALSATLDDEDDLDDWTEAGPVVVLIERSERLRNAYRDLRKQNERVSTRLKQSVFCLFTGYVLVFLALGIYLWGIGR